MRILVEAGDYALRNVGDTAMLRVALARLRALLPGARIDVLTSAADRYPAFAPDVTPLDHSGRRLWFDQPVLNELLLERISAGVRERMWHVDGWLKRRLPRLAMPLVRRGVRNRDIDGGDLEAFLDAVTGANLLVATGMGGITDAFEYSAAQILDVFAFGQRTGARTAMMGQGIGPLAGGSLRRRARNVLPRLDLLALREGRTGPRLARELGVHPDRMVVTGDDAVELAWAGHPERLGDGLGINLRLADYAGVGTDIVERVRPVLLDALARLGARPVIIPISYVPGEEDEATAVMLGVEAGGQTPIESAADALDASVARAGECRVVIAGSYHAAVFALSCGASAVALANSDYYRDKFLGLAERFGAGCTVVSPSRPDFPETLARAIDAAWQSAPSVREELLDAAARQVEAGRAAYRRLAELVSSRS